MKPGRASQQGAAALAVVMILLLAMTILAAFENRSLLFEQRSSANQYRSTIAAETAEAGLEWAQALLNDGRRLDAYCLPAADQPTSFRERYVPKSAPDAAIAPVTTVRPGCSLGATGLSCHCPDAGGSAEWNGNGPSFTVEFAAVSGDPQALTLALTFGDPRALEQLKNTLANRELPADRRVEALAALRKARPDFLPALLRSLLDDPAVRGLALRGLSDFDDAEKFLELGADRLGTSRLVKICKQ